MKRIYPGENRRSKTTSKIVILGVVGAVFIIGFSAQNVFAVGPEGSIYVANGFGKTVSVIDTKTNTVGSPIVVGNSPAAMAFDTAHKRMYVVNSQDDTVSVIDVKTDTVIKTIPIGDIGHEAAIAFDTAHKRMYVVASDDNSVKVIDTNTNTVVGSPIPLPPEISDQAFGITFDEKLKRMYVSSTQVGGKDWVTIIDTDTNSIFFFLQVEEGPLTMAFDSIHRRVYVLNSFAVDGISVIDSNAATVIGSPIPVSFNSREIAFDPIHQRVYVTNGFDDSVSVFDTNTHTVVGIPLFVGKEPEAIAFAPPLTTTNVFGPSLP